jgi:hypothetical protein
MARSKNGLKLRLSWRSDIHFHVIYCPTIAYGDLRVTTQAVERQKSRHDLITEKKLTTRTDSLISVETSRRGLISATQAYYPVHVKLNEAPPRSGYEGPDGEYRYSSTLSLTSALDGSGW